MRINEARRILWRAGCVNRTSGSGSGPQRPTGGDIGRALRVDFHYGPFRRWILTTITTARRQPCTCPPVHATTAADGIRMNLLKPLIAS
jgi:hypothetical protein